MFGINGSARKDAERACQLEEARRTVMDRITPADLARGLKQSGVLDSAIKHMKFYPARRPLPVDENWMRVAPGTDAAIWRPWSRETGEL